MSAETILVVDDDCAVRTLTQSLFEIWGYHVLIADDAEEAIRLFRGNTDIVLVLADAMMGGPEFVRQLQLAKPELKAVFGRGYTQVRAPASRE